MAFSSRRGRPRKQQSCAEIRDRGTIELQRKRSLSLTTELIDLLLHRDLITPDQHWCALHFRWLFTLRYGAPTPKSLDPAHIKGIQHGKIHGEWQEEREKEWRDAVRMLSQYNALRPLEACAIYNQLISPEIPKLQRGLSELAKLWCCRNVTLNRQSRQS